MADILTVKLKRYGWPEDEEPEYRDEILLEKRSGVIDNENEHIEWTEWRLDGKIVKRGAHVRLKRNVVAEGIAQMLG